VPEAGAVDLIAFSGERSVGVGWDWGLDGGHGLDSNRGVGDLQCAMSECAWYLTGCNARLWRTRLVIADCLLPIGTGESGTGKKFTLTSETRK
jgi:hypothetical protein